MSLEFWSWDRYDSEARRLYDEGNYDDAWKMLQEGLSLYPASAELRVSLGYAQLAREEFGWARRWFQEALDLEPDHEEGLVGMGEVLLKLGERGRALYCFQRLVELGFGEDSDLMISAGRALYREELFERATAFFQRAFDADPECADAAAEMAYAIYQLGDVEAAVGWCHRALELEPGLHEARAFLGNVLYDRGDATAALEHFVRIPPGELWDPVAMWRCVELLRRIRRLNDEDPLLEPYLVRFEQLNSTSTPEDRLLAEIERSQTSGIAELVALDRNQLDLFGWRPLWEEEQGVHRIQLSDGPIYEGDWGGIVRAMRDDSRNPNLSVAEFIREEVQRLHTLTGVRISGRSPKAFLQESARLGTIRIER